MHSIAKAVFLISTLCAVRGQYPRENFKTTRWISWNSAKCVDCDEYYRTNLVDEGWTCPIRKSDDCTRTHYYRPPSFCHYEECYQHCTLADANYDVEQCEFDDFEFKEDNDVGPTVRGLLVQVASFAAMAVPVYGPALSAGINFANGIFDAIQDAEAGSNPLFDAIKDHSERTTEQMVKCMDQKITAAVTGVVTENVWNAMKVCGLRYRSAAMYKLNNESSDAYDRSIRTKLDKLDDAWHEFLDVTNSRFDISDESNSNADPQYYKNLLVPLQDYVKAYELVTLDYLVWMYDLDRINYETHFGWTIQSLEVLLGWMRRAIYMLMEVDMRGKLEELPCGNVQEIEEEVRAWTDQFAVDHVKPILRFMGDLHHLNRILDITMPRTSTVRSCDVDVLSIDHKKGVNGMYFNFDEKQLDAILGTTSWSGQRLTVSNGKKVVVWRNPNGGSKGDAHGRWDVNPKANQFWVGQKVTFADCTAPKYCFLTVDSTQGPEGDEGKFFKFDKSALDAILGREDWSNERLEVGNGKEIVAWRYASGAHGRYASGAHGEVAKGNDWAAGDQITFVDCQIKL